MRLSTKSRYGVRALYDIAYHSQGLPTPIKEISRRQGVTPRYLEQIFQRLKKAGIVKSVRGPKGGYYLSRQPEEVVVSDIIRAMGSRSSPSSAPVPSREGRGAAGSRSAPLRWSGMKPAGVWWSTSIPCPWPACAGWPGN
jgi:Rrf2 family protein